MGTAGEESQAKEWEEEKEEGRKDALLWDPIPTHSVSLKFLLDGRKGALCLRPLKYQPGLGDLSPCEYTQPSFQKEILQS